MLTEHKIKLTCPHCHKRSDNLIDRTFDNYDKKWRTSAICPLCNRLTEFKQIDPNDIVEQRDTSNGNSFLDKLQGKDKWR